MWVEKLARSGHPAFENAWCFPVGLSEKRDECAGLTETSIQSGLGNGVSSKKFTGTTEL